MQMLPGSGIIINVFFLCDGRYLSVYKCDIKGEGKIFPSLFRTYTGLFKEKLLF